MKIIKIVCLLLAITTASLAAETSYDSTKAAINKAMESEIRNDKEKARDRNRKPVQTLEFFGFRKDMTVLELFPGGGWYSKILAPTLKQDGKYYAALGTGRLKDRLLSEKGFEKAKVLETGAKMESNPETRFYQVSDFDFGVKNIDIVFTFRNYHNFDVASRKRINQKVFSALKPGGIYAVVDHTRRHMQKLDNENVRRVDPVLAIKEIQQAGFELVDYSDLHYRADDELRFEVGRKTVTGNTDRFTLKFVKPK
jgi:predicted methyltransferase